MNGRWQVQEFDKPLIGAEAGSGVSQTTKPLTDYTDRWSACPISLPSSNTLPSHHNISTAGCLPYQQPSCSAWTGGFESTWKNDVSGVVLPWWNGSDDWMTPAAKLLHEPVLSVDRRHSVKHVKVRMVTEKLNIKYIFLSHTH